MTSEDIRSVLEKVPFVPFRLHLVSGKSIDVAGPRDGYRLQNAIMILDKARQGVEAGYNVAALRNIEMLELMPGRAEVNT